MLWIFFNDLLSIACVHRGWLFRSLAVVSTYMYLQKQTEICNGWQQLYSFKAHISVEFGDPNALMETYDIAPARC